MATPLARSAARQVARISTRACLAGVARPVTSLAAASAGPSSLPVYQARCLTTTPPCFKKSTKASGSGSGSKGTKPKSREEVENIDYEDPKLDQTLAKVGAKMEKAVEWAKLVVFESVERGRGRVSPCMFLRSVKVPRWQADLGCSPA